MTRKRRALPLTATLIGLALLSAPCAVAGSMEFHPVSWATATDTDEDGEFDVLERGFLLVQYISPPAPAPGIVKRSILEFDLSALPAGAVVTRARFHAAVGSGSAGIKTVQFLNYSGNGIAELDDAEMNVLDLRAMGAITTGQEWSHLHIKGVDLSSRIRELLAAGRTKPGFLVKLSNEVEVNHVQLANPGSPSEPRLVVEFESDADKVYLHELEVIQSIQDWETNEIRLIEDKSTVVRAHLRTIDPTLAVFFSEKLSGFRDGVELPESPLTSHDPTGTGVGIFVKPYGEADRSEMEDSLNYFLPSEWQHGTIQLRFASADEDFECRESGGPVPDDCSVTVTFEPATRPKIEYVRVRWEERVVDEEGNVVEILPSTQPNFDDVDLEATRLISMYPIDDSDYTVSEMLFDGLTPGAISVTEFTTAVIGRLELKRILDDCLGDCDRIYYGLAFGNLGGLAVHDGFVAMSGTDPLGGNTTTHGHEIAHVLGIEHVVSESLGLLPSGRKQGPCGESAPEDAPDFPHLVDLGVGDGPRPTIGHVYNVLEEDATIHGFDFFFFFNSIVGPFTKSAMMSYCRDFSPGPLRWISDVNYEAVYQRLAERFGPARASSPSPESSPVEYLIVSGTIREDTQEAEFFPFVTHSTVLSPPQLATGDYRLQLRDVGGLLLDEIEFQPSAVTDVPGEARARFAILIPANPAIHEVTLSYLGTPLATTLASGGVPVVQVLWPNGGELWTGNAASVGWSATDPDADPLRYAVQISTDGGGTWKTIAVDYASTELELDPGTVAGTDQALIRVVASDGFHSSEDDSDSVFAVETHPPSVTIVGFDGDLTFVNDEPIVFEARGHDAEDGRLMPSSFDWSSDTSGDLGSGSPLEILASDLGEGDHLLTVTAVDSDLELATDVVAITVELDSDLDGTFDSVDNCPAHYNPGQEAVVFGQQVAAAKDGPSAVFSWPEATDVRYVRGDLGAVQGYHVDVSATLLAATQVADSDPPAIAEGHYYLVQLAGGCPAASWQTSIGSEPDRDLALP